MPIIGLLYLICIVAASLARTAIHATNIWFYWTRCYNAWHELCLAYTFPQIMNYVFMNIIQTYLYRHVLCITVLWSYVNHNSSLCSRHGLQTYAKCFWPCQCQLGVNIFTSQWIRGFSGASVARAWHHSMAGHTPRIILMPHGHV